MTSRLRTRAKQFALGVLVAALGAGTYVIAAAFANFQAGDTISASEMNAKLNELHALATAGAASVSCPANTPTRFTDNGDGTVCDSQTGLMWEKKTGTVGAFVGCVIPTDCPDPHNVNNRYSWTTNNTGSTCLRVSPAPGSPVDPDCADPDGPLFENFLFKINKGESSAGNSGSVSRAGYTDWRIPNIVELQSILIAKAPPSCPTSPCIDPIFGETQPIVYWTSSTREAFPDFAWTVRFNDGVPSVDTKQNLWAVRAVRGGR